MRGTASGCVKDQIGKICSQTSPASLRCNRARLRTLLPRFRTTKTLSRHRAGRHIALQNCVGMGIATPLPWSHSDRVRRHHGSLTVGFNMSWVFVDRIDLNELYAALDVKSTGEAADPLALGTKRVPLAGLKPKDGWCAIFGHYSFVLDITIGTDPPRLTRLPASSRAVSCVVLEHANISYASLWQDDRHIWEVRRQPSRAQPEHLEFWGDLPPAFIDIWDATLQKQRESDASRKPGEWGVDYLF